VTNPEEKKSWYILGKKVTFVFLNFVLQFCAS
jgi:hypothetical protein